MDDSPHLALSAEQSQFADQLRQVLRRRWDHRELLAEQPGEVPLGADLWRQLDADLHLAELTVPTAFGGTGAGAAELALVSEEFGRALCPAPLLSIAALAVPLLAEDTANPDRAALLARIASGGLIAAVAWDNVSVTHARDHSGRSVLTGSTVRVCDGDEARVLLTVCPVDGVETLFSVELDQPGVRRRRLVGLDRARIHADITFTGAPATALGPVHGRLERALRLARITVAADLVGVSVRCTELAVDYARQRQQFGRLIGSFQAIKHRCARMFIGAEQARSFVRDAAWRADHATDDVALAAEGALWFAAETAIATTADLIRVLGGTGFTWEHEAHLYFRRARAQAVLFGGQMRRCATVADRVMVL